MAMTKAEREDMMCTVRRLQADFPHLTEEQAVKLNNKIYCIAVRVKQMEARYCNEYDLDELRDITRSKAKADVRKALEKFGAQCRFNLSTDSRGPGVWLHLPSGRGNTMGGDEAGWGF